jgi:transketolase
MRVVTQTDLKAVNTLRGLALDAVAKAKEGHPGAPLGMAPMAYVLWTQVMRYNPKNPHWAFRDRFVLSAGHASMLLYGALHLTGYDLSLEDLKQFRQYGSKTPGHPEYGHAPGVETTTGPLGQGFANAVGMALAQHHLAAKFNQPGHALFDSFVYGICSDGDLQEGISHEAASLAGHLGLSKLVMLYDDNHIQLDGPTSWAFSEDISLRFSAYGWQVLEVADGDTDFEGLRNAIEVAKADNRPSLIRVKTTIGYGLPKAGTADVHGKAPSLDDVIAAKKSYGFTDLEPFALDTEGCAAWRMVGDRGSALEAEKTAQLEAYKAAHPELSVELEMYLSNAPSHISLEDLPKYEPGGKPVRTRNASGDSINAIAKLEPRLLGGSADLSSSNITVIKGDEAIRNGEYAPRNINFGVREHAMAAIGSGLALSGLRPYVGTFFTFSDYMKNSIRLAAMSHLPVVFVFTHDSIGVGTDGPTHQPIEHLAGLRAIPNLSVIRPADANETSVAWKLAMDRTDGPTALILSRQDLPVLAAKPAGAMKGGYVVKDSSGGSPEVILIATGSEVSLALEAEALLAGKGVRARVVSLPSWDIFAKQSQQYRDAILPPSVRARVAIEAAASLGWERFVGLEGRMVCLDRFGASAPESVVFKELGFTPEHVAQVALETLGRS